MEKGLVHPLAVWCRICLPHAPPRKLVQLPGFVMMPVSMQQLARGRPHVACSPSDRA